MTRWLARATPLALLVAGTLQAQPVQPPPDSRRSGFDFMSPATQALQRDDTLNPAALWLQDGAQRFEAGCARCHTAASMRGVAPRYPAFDTASQGALTLAGRINACRVRHAGQPRAGRWRATRLLALEMFVANASRGLPIAPPADARLAPLRERGRQLYTQRLGQLDFSCAQCHDQHAGGRLAGSLIPQAPPHRLPDLPAGMAGRGFAAAAAAQLHERRARRALGLRRAGVHGAGAVPDAARRRHGAGDAGRAALRSATAPDTIASARPVRRHTENAMHAPSDSSDPSATPALEATRRWLEQAVIGLNLCPFAKAVHLKQQIRWVLSEARDAEALLADLVRELQFLAAADPEQVDTTLLVHPQVLNDFLDYNDFLDVADAAIDELGLDGVLQVASFHPDYQFEGTERRRRREPAATARRTRRCTCCAKTASTVRWRPSPTPPTSTNATSPRCASWAWRAGAPCWRARRAG